jgi:tetratricopeptide (TPR) repeat protein
MLAAAMALSGIVLPGAQAPAPASARRAARADAPSPAPRLHADAEYRAALELLYDGSTEAALQRLAELARSAPRDPVAPYLHALALCWKIEQRPETTAMDKELHRLADRALELADAALERDSGDARARMARGAAHGVKSRLHLFRLRRRDAAREAVRMREDLLLARELDPDDADVAFGLGLYDYYADVLPRIAKLLRFLAGIPGGDRERGLALIESARDRSAFHDTEVRVQLYEIHAFYEHTPDRALEEMAGLRWLYPGSPLWALKLAEHQRDRMGLYAESAAVAREVLELAAGGHPNYSEVAAAMARVSLGESLLLDLRFAEARRALLPARDGVPGTPWVGARARLLLGRSLELEGDREGAEVHYRVAANSADQPLQRRAEEALSSPVAEEEVRATPRLAEGRRHREAGRRQEAAEAFAAALRSWPECQEALVRVAEEELARARPRTARELLERLDEDDPHPPWIRPWSRLLLAQVEDLEGNRAEAVVLYQKVFKAPYGRAELKNLAAAGLKRPFVPRHRRPAPAPAS